MSSKQSREISFDAVGQHEAGVSTLSVHAGEQRQKVANSITDPVVLASTFTFTDKKALSTSLKTTKTAVSTVGMEFLANR